MNTPLLRYFMARFVADVWDPDRAPTPRLRLRYRARGIVQFDRVLNNELDRAMKERP